ncbi:unnamed protein product [Vitrella brassicaformis CCMP3155]|uniref:Carboxyvinyl-carboxyphosphonate phosphorylmutase n=1 Tax=Vitrella brassicaformis (strain CCMP3155) TaxID=1169540 RepID=A0A0G4H7X5_VITBC|nr:unnamed protein product [Vitrella brassicaformis CCMP3155]|mmetsp:Transcript_22178/g.63262  ORF Transcript_22178/g.63262 Transcript_22178/m.63262 type:complete len:343 (+) Transcript_22178:153-1181(+)|eukprot:CEM39781.1 unnamed protein product [Vitrella brassicaformis CCMP3155]
MMGPHRNPAAERLRELLNSPTGVIQAPGCYDDLTARLVEQEGFPCAFMSGFSVSGARGFPDTQMLAYSEMLDSCRAITEAVKSIPLIADGDTGYGNAVNVKRTVQGYARAGVACIMIEDQVAPKKCGHPAGKEVIPFEDACMRVMAAIDARDEGADICILARTDARASLGLDEAIRRCRAFHAMGADIAFLEAPRTVEEMRRYCSEVGGPKMANLIEGGSTPFLSVDELEEVGYKLVIYSTSLVSTSIKAVRGVLGALKNGHDTTPHISSFSDLKAVVGFNEYNVEERKYAVASKQQQEPSASKTPTDSRTSWPEFKHFSGTIARVGSMASTIASEGSVQFD